jgi:PAS domain S-box-containing protein
MGLSLVSPAIQVPGGTWFVPAGSISPIFAQVGTVQLAIAATIFTVMAGIALALGRANERNRRLTIELTRRNEQLKHFQSIISSSNDSILSLDLSYHITSWNPAAERLYGYTEAEALHQSVSLLCPSGEPSTKQLELARAGESLSNFETILMRKSGQPVDVALTLSPIRSEAGDVIGISAITRDLSGQKRVEHALSQERFLIETLMDNIPDHIYFKDLESRFIRVNRAMARRFGLAEPAEAVGKSDFDFFTAEHAKQALADEQEIVRTGKAMVDHEEKETWPDGSVSWVSTTKECLRGKQGEILGTFGLSRDITARKAAEDALEEKAGELTRSNRELEQFAYVASHDLQEPLRMIASYTQLLARRYEGKLDNDALEFIGYAVEGATRMQVLINDLLSYSRVGTRGKPFGSTDCNEVLARALENLKIAIEDAKATVTSSSLPMVIGDGVQLTQLMQNLVSNAVKFRGAPPKVHLSAELKRAPLLDPETNLPMCEWVFSIKDNGIGIEPQYFERIFVIFQRLHTREQYPGTGIGLAICKKIVERHGGRIWVESVPKEGTTFYFTIPRIEPEI